MSDPLNFQDVVEVVVKYSDGTEVAYVKKGLEKLRVLFVTSARIALSNSSEKLARRVVVDDDDLDEVEVDDDGVEETPPPPRRRGARRAVDAEPPPPRASNGYSSVHLNYASTGAADVTKSGGGGRSAFDIAKEMQREASGRFQF